MTSISSSTSGSAASALQVHQHRGGRPPQFSKVDTQAFAGMMGPPPMGPPPDQASDEGSDEDSTEVKAFEDQMKTLVSKLHSMAGRQYESVADSSSAAASSAASSSLSAMA